MEIKQLLSGHQSPVLQHKPVLGGSSDKRHSLPTKRKCLSGNSSEKLRVERFKGAHANSGYDKDEKHGTDQESGTEYSHPSMTSV